MVMTSGAESAKRTTGCAILGLLGTIFLVGALIIIVVIVQLGRGLDEPWPGPPFWLPEPLFEGFVAVETVPLHYQDECPECGASFAIDSFEAGMDGTFRLLLTVRNTGEFGPLRYAVATVHAMTAEQAERYRLGFEAAFATGQPGAFLNEVTSNRYLSPIPSATGSLPTVIQEGGQWTGWVHFTGAPGHSAGGSSPGLPKDAVELVLVMSPASTGTQPTWTSSSPEARTSR